MTDQIERLRTALGSRFEVVRELGRGGMATVFLARDLQNQRDVAIKVLNPELAAVLGGDRFLREIRIAARLQHPHILPLHDSGQAGDLLYYVMPYVPGVTLRSRIAREGELPVADVVRILREVVDALAYAHAQGVVHRDIKPDNVMVSGRHVLVADFGVAKAVRDATGGSDRTTAGVAIGTPAYMAPEQAAGDPLIDHRADIYAVGVMAFELLTGTVPFQRSTTQAILAAHVTETPEPVTKRRSAVPAALNDIVMKCLEKKPADRWQTADELLRELEALSPATTSVNQAEAPMPSLRGSPPRKYLPIVGGLAAVTAIALLGFTIWRGRNAGGPAVPRLVVLPFENLCAVEDAYLAEGMTEEITSKLAGLSGLGVIARTSAMQYRGVRKPIRQIASELNVDWVLEGTVRCDKASGLVRVSPQLIRAADETHVWAEPQSGSVLETFKFQAAVAERVAAELGVKLAQQEHAGLASAPTDNPEAYDLYFRGVATMSRSVPPTLEELRAAIDLFQKAVTLDSAFAHAYARLSRSSILLWNRTDHSEAMLRQARGAAEKAVALAPDLPEAHAALGYFYYVSAFDYDGALREYELAERAGPASSDLLGLIAVVHLRQGRYQKAIDVAERAVELDPMNVNAIRQIGGAYTCLGRYAEAARYAGRALALSPGGGGAYFDKALLRAIANDTVGTQQVMREMIAHMGPVGILNMQPTVHWYLVPRWIDAAGRLAFKQVALTPAIQQRDRYYLVKAESHQLDGELASARRDFALAVDELLGLLRRGNANPFTEAVWRSALGIAYARLGRPDAAKREEQRARELVPVSSNAWNGGDWSMLGADVHVIIGDHDGALRILEEGWNAPGVPEQYVWKLNMDPLYDPLRGKPRFEKLAAWQPARR